MKYPFPTTHWRRPGEKSAHPEQDAVFDPGKVRLCAASYVGADYETVSRPVVSANLEYLTVHRADYERNMARLRELETERQAIVDYTALDDGSAMTDEVASANRIKQITADNVRLQAEVMHLRRAELEALGYKEQASGSWFPPDPDGEAASNSGDNTSDGVKAHIEKTIDHLQHHRVTDGQLGDLKKATEQAGRTRDYSDSAIGRARHHSR